MSISWLFPNNRIKEELRSQRAQYLRLIENIPEVVWRATEDGDAIFISQRIQELFGYTAEEVLRQGSQLWFGRMHPEDRDTVKCAYAELFRTGRKFDVQYRIQHRDGRWMWWHDRSNLVEHDSFGGRYADGILSDVTHVKSLEDRVRQSQKLEAIGQLAGGIAHDFNNLLQVISGYAELLEARPENDLKAREHTNKIKGAASRARSLTEQLLGFSRRQLQQVVTLDLNDIVFSFETMLRRALGESVELTLHHASSPAWIRADQSQIEQILMNLVLNAREAMPHGGKLAIDISHVAADDLNDGSHTGIPRGEYVLLAVSDTGMGMDAKSLARAFEPFYTTKPGKTRGLGLATVYGVVKQSGGEILATSQPAMGTCFRIYLPSIAPASTNPNERSVGSRMHAGETTILIAEDEPAVRDLACAFLECFGYRVYCASNASAALEFADSFDGSIHLLLTDMVMPGCSGSELAQKLGARLPGLKVLYMTGYTDDKLLRLELQGCRASVLRKPFNKEQLAAAVQTTINGLTFMETNSHFLEPASAQP